MSAAARTKSGTGLGPVPDFFMGPTVAALWSYAVRPGLGLAHRGVLARR